jgi:hypothetical protein
MAVTLAGRSALPREQHEQHEQHACQAAGQPVLVRGPAVFALRKTGPCASLHDARRAARRGCESDGRIGFCAVAGEWHGAC